MSKEELKEYGFEYFTDSYGYWRGFKKLEDNKYLVVHIGQFKIMLEEKKEGNIKELYLGPKEQFKDFLISL